MDSYKIISIIFIFMILALSITIYFQQQSYDVPGFELTNSQLKEFSELTGGEFEVCNIDTNKCFRVIKRGDA